MRCPSIRSAEMWTTWTQSYKETGLWDWTLSSMSVGSIIKYVHRFSLLRPHWNCTIPTALWTPWIPKNTDILYKHTPPTPANQPPTQKICQYKRKTGQNRSLEWADGDYQYSSWWKKAEERTTEARAVLSPGQPTGLRFKLLWQSNWKLKSTEVYPRPS